MRFGDNSPWAGVKKQARALGKNRIRDEQAGTRGESPLDFGVFGGVKQARARARYAAFHSRRSLYAGYDVCPFFPGHVNTTTTMTTTRQADEGRTKRRGGGGESLCAHSERWIDIVCVWRRNSACLFVGECALVCSKRFGFLFLARETEELGVVWLD